MGPADLAEVLARLPAATHPDLLVGSSTSDDAGVFRLRDDLALVNTVDFFTPIVDDPWTYGAISAANSLSDVYAMGGEPRTALAVVCFPRGDLPLEILAEILRGGQDKLAEAGALVIGGHTVDDPELKYGLAVMGVIHPNRIVRNVGARPGDALVLTKALGTGILTTALKREALGPEETLAVTESMLRLNREASTAMLRHEAHAATDVTGFGLLGHAREMASGSGVTLRIDAGALPVLPGGLEQVRAGNVPGGCRRNEVFLEDKVRYGSDVPVELRRLALDPQTSGGLLLAVAAERAGELLADLRAGGDRAAARIGVVTERAAAAVILDLG